MRVTIISADDLDASLRERWHALQAASPELASPYFCPGFTEAVAAVRNDVRVAVLEDGARIVGFFPFQRRLGGFGRPVGLGMSDYHGLIAAPDLAYDPVDLLRRCGLVRWQFDHLLACQERFTPWMTAIEESPIMNVSGGFEHYVMTRLALGGTEIKTVRRRMRQLEREIGPIDFVVQEQDSKVLERVLELKSRQCRQSGAYDFFTRAPWTRALVKHLFAQQEAQGFQGVLSSLYADGQCIAAHFGLRSRDVWHWWFPCYETEFGRYSPGLLLLYRLAKHAAAVGLRHVDLGRGMSRYKLNLMTESVRLAEGCVARESPLMLFPQMAEAAQHMESRFGFRTLFRIPAGLVRRARRRGRFM
jgi:CelD/BcsL family acetyltransferase involved in cellulose biosynthesis